MLELNKTNFGTTTSKGVVIVDAWAPWCVQCKGMERVIDAIATELSGKATIGKINIADDMEFASTLGITSLPAFLIFKDGKKVDQRQGMLSKKIFSDWVSAYA